MNTKTRMRTVIAYIFMEDAVYYARVAEDDVPLGFVQMELDDADDVMNMQPIGKIVEVPYDYGKYSRTGGFPPTFRWHQHWMHWRQLRSYRWN